MKIYELYIQFMVWLGAAPPEGFEHLLEKQKTDITTGVAPTNIHLYKPKLSSLLLCSIPIVLLGAIVGGHLVIFVTAIFRGFQDELRGWIVGPFLLCLLGLPVIVMSVLVVELLIVFIAQFFAYLKVSSTGIEYQMWPFGGVCCRWSNTDRIGKGILKGDIIYLKNGEGVGASVGLSRIIQKISPIRIPESIPLSGFRGWPQGRLAEDLQRYAPHLFDRDLA